MQVQLVSRRNTLLDIPSRSRTRGYTLKNSLSVCLCLFLYLFVSLCVCVSFCLCLCLSLYLFLSLSLSFCLSFSFSLFILCLFFFCLSRFLSRSLSLSFYLYSLACFWLVAETETTSDSVLGIPPPSPTAGLQHQRLVIYRTHSQITNIYLNKQNHICTPMTWDSQFVTN